MTQLPSNWQLPEQIKDRFGQKSAGKQRAMFAEGHLLLVLHKAPQLGMHDRQTVFFWRKPNGDWEYSGRGRGFPALKQHIEEYDIAAHKFSKDYERALEAEDYFELLEDITPLLRAAKNLHATMQSARESVKDDRSIIDLRDWADEIERTLEILQMEAKNALDFKMAQKVEEQAKYSLQSVKAAHRLNILAAVFFPLTAISCLFGMNIPSGLEGSSIAIFWLVFLGGIGLGFLVRRWVVDGKWF
ncbi:MAG: CorA family divalent cation transporter [Halothece sp.]